MHPIKGDLLEKTRVSKELERFDDLFEKKTRRKGGVSALLVTNRRHCHRVRGKAQGAWGNWGKGGGRAVEGYPGLSLQGKTRCLVGKQEFRRKCACLMTKARRGLLKKGRS